MGVTGIKMSVNAMFLSYRTKGSNIQDEEQGTKDRAPWDTILSYGTYTEDSIQDMFTPPIPTILVKQNSDVLALPIARSVNVSLRDGECPYELKLAYVSPTLEKNQH